MAEGVSVKPAPAISWSALEGRDTALAQRCLAGDETACAELVEEHRRMVYQLALHLLRDPQEALDLSQDVFLRVFRSLHQFRGQSALRTWIYRIVVTQARNRQRWWRRRHSYAQVSLDAHIAANGELPATTPAAEPDRVFSQKEVARRLWDALEHLPFDQRTAMVLREIDGLSYEEIAFSLGVVVGTVKSRLARARQTLRAELGDL
jgi:RNA polymerase sigma-70 factor (ECF subfamily)